MIAGRTDETTSKRAREREGRGQREGSISDSTQLQAIARCTRLVLPRKFVIPFYGCR